MAMPGAVTSNTRYVIHTHFTVNQSVPGLANIENRLQRLNRLTNAVGRSFAVISAGVGIRRLAHAFVGVHTEIEDARAGLAGLITAITGMDAPTALERAAKAVTEMRQAAARLPGELPEYMNALQMVYAPVARAGGTLDDATRIAQKAVLAGYALAGKKGATTLPIDVGQALTQGVGAYTTRHLNILLGKVDPKYNDPKKFNKLPYHERLEAVTKALDKMDTAADILGKTWTAQSATMRDNLREIGRQASGGLFEVMKADLIKVNELIAANTDSIHEWARGIDRVLVKTYTLSRSKGLDPGFRQGAAQVGGTALGGLVGRQIGTLAYAAQIARGVPGVNMIVNLITLIGAAFGNIMAKYPADTARFVDSITMLFAAIGRLLAGIVEVIVTNPYVEVVMLDALRAMTVFLQDITIFLNGIYEVVQAFQWLNRELGKTGFVDWATGNYKDAAILGQQRTKDSFDIQWRYNPTSAWPMPYEPYVPRARDAKNLDELLKMMEYPEQSELDERDLVGVGDTNLNGPITIIIKAERVDNPDLVARSFREVHNRFQEYRRGGRSRLVPKPG